MRKKSIILALISMLFLTNNLVAQDYVSTQPQKRKALLEEFTGRNCQNCPMGHMVANNLVINNPGNLYAVNVHLGHYSPTSYPNFNTDMGYAIYGAFDITAYPHAIINRTTSYSLSRDQWYIYVNEQLAQNAECNIDGEVMIDPSTRMASINVEVYYTANSSSSTNYLNIYMLQDSIWGSQAGGSDNPMQYENGYYCHMHVLRAALTPTWGDAISPTTAGTLIKKTYQYQIPQTIGSPNGVDVDINNLTFLAFVTEKYDGTPTRPILNVKDLHTYQGTLLSVYPTITSIAPSTKFHCSNEKVISVSVYNAGINSITSMEIETRVNNGSVVKHTWEGVIPSHETKEVEIEVEVPAGSSNVRVEIVKANDQEFEEVANTTVQNDGWEEMEINSVEEEVTIEIMQDKYGNQTTWKLFASNGSVIASGGPYSMLSGASATKLHEIKVNISAGECIKFVIEDVNGNGICCNYGEGYYRIINANGNVVLDGDGAFGSKAEHILSVVYDEIETESLEAQICEGESYTEYGFEFIEPAAGTYHETNLYNGMLYILDLTVVANPVVVIDGATTVEIGESVTLTASGADAYVWSTGDSSVSITVTPEETTTYTVVGTKDGCEGSAEITVEVTVGIGENETIEANIYPNPTKDELMIECQGMKEITVVMPNGQVVEKINVSDDKYGLDMSDYRSGIYYVKIMTNDNNVRVYKSVRM